jgi:hypothetical protein
MATEQMQIDQDAEAHGPKYLINIEGTDYPWDSRTITVPQIRQLGGIPADQAIVEINLQTQEERTLGEDEIVTLQPGRGFAKKVKFQRG